MKAISVLAVLLAPAFAPLASACDIFSTSAVNCHAAVAGYSAGYSAAAYVQPQITQQVIAQAVPVHQVVPVATYSNVYSAATIVQAQPVIHTQTFAPYTVPCYSGYGGYGISSYGGYGISSFGHGHNRVRVFNNHHSHNHRGVRSFGNNHHHHRGRR